MELRPHPNQGQVNEVPSPGFLFGRPAGDRVAESSGRRWQCGVCSAWNGHASTGCVACMAFRPQDDAARADGVDGVGGGDPGTDDFPPSPPPVEEDPRERMEEGSALEEVRGASERLRSELARSERELRSFTEGLEHAERRIEERYELLQTRRSSIEEMHGNPNASEDDLVEINAGGKVVAARRGTLCQIEGSYLAAIFGGRWDEKLMRDSCGRIFLDVNPKCFLAIVDYLSYLKLSHAEEEFDPPSVSDEYHHILVHQIRLFGLEDAVFPSSRGRMTRALAALDSNIVRSEGRARLLHRWLDEDGSDGDLRLLYRSSRDGSSGKDFHDKCDHRGSTLTVIETTQGLVIGGYSNTAWGPRVFPAPQAPGGFKFVAATIGGPASNASTFGASTNNSSPFGASASNGFGYAHPGPVFGSRSISSWNRSPANMDTFKSAGNAFLFVYALDGTLLSKMEVKQPYKRYAICSQSTFGPTFGSDTVGTIDPFGPGHDLHVKGSRLYFSPGSTYDDHSRKSQGYGNYDIKELEVFQVAPPGADEMAAFSVSSHPNNAEATNALPARQQESKEPIVMSEATSFSKSVNDALNSKLKSLQDAEEEISSLENRLRDEECFIDSFASGDAKDVIALNVCGTTMTTKRSTLRVFEESALARQFDDSVWTEQRNADVKEWTYDDVSAWVEAIDGISGEVMSVFREHEITGRELTALGIEGLKMIGIKRAGTICLLLDEIRKLEKAATDDGPLIEHSPYSFGKILDYLRLKHLYVENLVEDEPQLPHVREAEKNRFEMTVNYFFPGDSARLILG